MFNHGCSVVVVRCLLFVVRRCSLLCVGFSSFVVRCLVAVVCYLSMFVCGLFVARC